MPISDETRIASEVRKGVRQARYNEKTGLLLGFESLFVGFIIGMKFHSFTAGFISVFVFAGIVIFLTSVPVVGMIIHSVLSLFWAYLAFGFSLALSNSLVLAIFVGFLVFLIFLGIRLATVQDIRDLST